MVKRLFFKKSCQIPNLFTFSEQLYASDTNSVFKRIFLAFCITITLDKSLIYLVYVLNYKFSGKRNCISSMLHFLGFPYFQQHEFDTNVLTLKLYLRAAFQNIYLWIQISQRRLVFVVSWNVYAISYVYIKLIPLNRALFVYWFFLLVSFFTLPWTHFTSWSFLSYWCCLCFWTSSMAVFSNICFRLHIFCFS